MHNTIKIDNTKYHFHFIQYTIANMSTSYSHIDECLEHHETIIYSFFKHMIQKHFDIEFSEDSSFVIQHIDIYLDEVFNSWKLDGLNFAASLRNDDRRWFDSSRMLDYLILYNNHHFKNKHNINWIYQVNNFRPNTIINTYASIYAYSIKHKIIELIDSDTCKLLQTKLSGVSLYPSLCES